MATVEELLAAERAERQRVIDELRSAQDERRRLEDAYRAALAAEQAAWEQVGSSGWSDAQLKQLDDVSKPKPPPSFRRGRSTKATKQTKKASSSKQSVSTPTVSEPESGSADSVEMTPPDL